VTDRGATADRVASLVDSAWGNLLVVDGASADQVADAGLVLVDVPGESPVAVSRAADLASRLRDATIPVVVLGGSLGRDARIALYRAGVLACTSLDEDPEELAARFASLACVKRVAAEALSRLREHSRHVNEELRLAQRLQMDFLPRQLPTLGGSRFAARLEPASWVAGDFYDVFRLDENHVGFYVADAVGHGVPAALLTVFVKRSLQTKRIEDHHYELIPPDEALSLLNADLLSAELQESPFITMVYGIYDAATRECVYALAGHPKPLLLGPDGRCEALDADGALLGIFRDAEFHAARRLLAPGQRLLLYTDGAEQVEPGGHANPDRLLDLIRASAALPADAMLDAILAAVHAAAEGGPLADDVTLVALDVGA
jgi:sigma-B regulation protein RsbU (phosphoserine phosphatase)